MKKTMKVTIELVDYHQSKAKKSGVPTSQELEIQLQHVDIPIAFGLEYIAKKRKRADLELGFSAGAHRKITEAQRTLYNNARDAGVVRNISMGFTQHTKLVMEPLTMAQVLEVVSQKAKSLETIASKNIEHAKHMIETNTTTLKRARSYLKQIKTLRGDARCQ